MQCLLTLGTVLEEPVLEDPHRVGIQHWEGGHIHVVEAPRGPELPYCQRLQIVGPSSIAGEQDGDAVLCLLEALGLVDVILHGRGSVRKHLVEEARLICVIDLLLGQSRLLQDLFQLGWEGV